MEGSELASRLQGGMLGMLVGDALGVPYEFHGPASLPERVEMVPPQGFRRAHPGTPPGTWSDDGATALALLHSLLSSGGLDLEDLGRRLRAWLDDGAYAVDQRVFDVGNATRSALSRLERGVPAVSAGGTGEHDNGNGSLMRVLPLALWHQGDAVELVDLALRQGLPTHGHRRAQLCCGQYCLWIRGLLAGESSAAAWAAAEVVLRAQAAARGPGWSQELDDKVLIDWSPRGTGYVVDCLHSARLAMEAPDYEGVVRAAIALGHDTDTTACVAGGAAGVRFGVHGIPEAWRAALRGREICDPLIAALVALRTGSAA